MKAVKNYSSSIAINRIFTKLQKVLAEHGAKHIVFDYGDDGKIYGMTFVIETAGRKIPIKLPARVDKAASLLERQYREGLIKSRKVLEPEQAYRVAWRNILDWVDAQMALLDIEMAKIEEIFLPYMADQTGKTFFELMEKSDFLLPEPKKKSNTPLRGIVTTIGDTVIDNQGARKKK